MSELTIVLQQTASSLLKQQAAQRFRLSPYLARNLISRNYYECGWQVFNQYKNTSESKSKPPIAAIMAIADGLPAATQHWLCATPVSLAADLSQVFLTDTARECLNTKQLGDLLIALNHLLVDDGLCLRHGFDKLRWYIQSANAFMLETTALPNAFGQSIKQYLPSGDDAVFWRKRLTEMQMLIKMKLEIMQPTLAEPFNSVWLWGEGSLILQDRPDYYQQVIGDDSFAQGLAAWCQLPYHQAKKNQPWPPLLAVNSLWLAKDLSMLSHVLDLLSQKHWQRVIIYTAQGNAFRLKQKRFNLARWLPKKISFS